MTPNMTPPSTCTSTAPPSAVTTSVNADGSNADESDGDISPNGRSRRGGPTHNASRHARLDLDGAGGWERPQSHTGLSHLR
mmetsp:Transcript_14031/g.36142  ORF Transcript_14031/g.36142 Transcript_14031/m.36142 type:complete len:81 (+) Transcript_14031:131-373(+)